LYLVSNILQQVENSSGSLEQMEWAENGSNSDLHSRSFAQLVQAVTPGYTLPDIRMPLCDRALDTQTSVESDVMFADMSDTQMSAGEENFWGEDFKPF